MSDLYIVPPSGDTIAFGRTAKPGAGVTISGAVSNVRNAAGGVSGHRVVIYDSSGNVTAADNTNLAHAAAISGISLDAGSIGDPIAVADSGEVDEPSWSWTPQRELFLNGTTGQISHTAPTVGFCVSVGFAVTATRMRVRIGKAVILA